MTQAASPTVNPLGFHDKLRQKLVGHSNLIYWWPVWLFGFIMCVITWGYGDEVLFREMKDKGANWYTLLSLIYLCVIAFIVFATNIRAQGAAAVNALLVFGIAIVGLYFLADRGGLLIPMPNCLVFMNTRFYFIFSTLIFVMWLFSIYSYDRRTIWIVQPGLLVERRWPNRDRNFGMKDGNLSATRDDIACHMVLGLGRIGDVQVDLGKGVPVIIHNVWAIGKKIAKAQKILAIQITVQEEG